MLESQKILRSHGVPVLTMDRWAEATRPYVIPTTPFHTTRGLPVVEAWIMEVRNAVLLVASLIPPVEWRRALRSGPCSCTIPLVRRADEEGGGVDPADPLLSARSTLADAARRELPGGDDGVPLTGGGVVPAVPEEAPELKASDLLSLPLPTEPVGERVQGIALDPLEEQVSEVPPLPDELAPLSQDCSLASSVPFEATIASKIIQEEASDEEDGDEPGIKTVGDVRDESMGQAPAGEVDDCSLAASFGALPIATPLQSEREGDEKTEGELRDERRSELGAQFLSTGSGLGGRGEDRGAAQVFRAAAECGGELVGLIASAEYLANTRTTFSLCGL
jgi:hypothetical protein